MQFEFATAARIIFGARCSRQASALAREFGNKLLVVTGGNANRADWLLSGLKGTGFEPQIFSVSGEPEIETVIQGLRIAKQQSCDLVISIGGGSVLDTGKAIAAMLTNGGEILDYLEVIGRAEPLTKTSAPFIAIPTTAGTGSEVTRNAVLGSREHHVKVSLRSAHMLPKVALIDPELTYGLPPAITASTGLDALTQLIEPFVSSRANPMTDALCREGIPRVARSLRVAFNDGQNPSARKDMSLASLFGGIALANAGLGAVHGFAGPIGGMFHAPHGAICAALLTHVMKMNLQALRSRRPESQPLLRFDEIARLLTGNQDARAEDGIDWVQKLVSDLQIPSLSHYGISASHTPELVEKASKASSMKANPITLTSAELAQALEQAL